MSADERLTTGDLARAQTEGGGADQLAEEGSADTSSRRGQDAASAQGQDANRDLQPLLDASESESFRSRWQSIQTGFVDQPEQSVQQADALVAELMQRLAQTFNEERQSLEEQLRGSPDTSTEDLRVGLQRYRSFFERLLST